MKLFDRLRDVGYEKPRMAVALLPLSFFALLYFLIGLNAPPGWGRAFAALSITYLVAFLALASEWFWARWFASGLGWSGAMVAIAATVTIGWQPQLAIYGLLHGLVVLLLMGPKMAARYDLQPAWRERYGMDEFGVLRLRKAVTRAAAALPSVIVWALGPREQAFGIALAVLTIAGLTGLLRLRAWGVLALGGAAALAVVGAPGVEMASTGCVTDALQGWSMGLVRTADETAMLWLPLAVLPFVGPTVRFLTSRR